MFAYGRWPENRPCTRWIRDQCLLPSQAALTQFIDIPSARHGKADCFTRRVQGNRLFLGMVQERRSLGTVTRSHLSPSMTQRKQLGREGA